MRLQEIAMKKYSKAVEQLTMKEADQCYQAWWELNADDDDNVEQFMNEDNVWN